MNYDKNSFLSGLAVGRQLKGWGAANAPLRQEGPTAGASLAPVPVVPVSSVLGAGLTGAPTALGWLSVGEVLQIPCGITVTVGFQGTVTVSNAILEVEN